MTKTPKIALFGHIFSKIAQLFFNAWSLLLVHVRFTPKKGPKGFKNALFRNWTMEVLP